MPGNVATPPKNFAPLGCRPVLYEAAGKPRGRELLVWRNGFRDLIYWEASMRHFLLAAFVSILVIIQLPASAHAECRTEYGAPTCAEYNTNGTCKRFERSEIEVCTGGKDESARVSPSTTYCYDCTSYNRDGSCRTTKKRAC
jgi:hypothetical protein